MPQARPLPAKAEIIGLIRALPSLTQTGQLDLALTRDPRYPQVIREHECGAGVRDMHDRSASLRTFFASYVSRTGRARSPRIERAFAAVMREPFVGPGPWSIAIPGVGYVKTPDADIAFIYQDTLVALD